MMVHRSIAPVRTLVVHSGGIGDFLLFCPSLKRLAEEGPVELAGNDRDRLNLAVVSGIAENAHLLDDIDFASIFSEPSAPFKRFVAKFHRVIVWMTDEDGRIRAALLDAGAPHVQVYPGLPPAGWSRHASAYYASSLGLEALPPLLLPFEDDGYAHDILIHPGSGAAHKNWPIESYAALDDALLSAGRTVEWIRGPAEERIRFPDGARVLEVVSLVTLARHLSGTVQYVGNDSGITHLAAASGCRTVAIFLHTDPAVWAPRGDNVSVVQGKTWPDVSEVLAAIGS